MQMTDLVGLSYTVKAWEGNAEELFLSDESRVGNNLFCDFFAPQMYVLPLAKGKALQLAVKCSVGSHRAAREHVASDMTGQTP